MKAGVTDLPMTTHQQPDEGSRQADLERVLAILRCRAGLIGLRFFVTAAAAFGFSKLQQKESSDLAPLLIRSPGFAEDLFVTSATASMSDATRQVASNEKLVGLLQRKTAASLDFTRDYNERSVQDGHRAESFPEGR